MPEGAAGGTAVLTQGGPHDAAGRRISAVLVQVADLLAGLAVVPSQGSTG